MELKMSRTIHLLAFLGTLSLLSCNKTVEPCGQQDNVTLSLCASCPTKTRNEDVMNSLDLLVFSSEDGVLLSRSRSESDIVSCEIPRGRKVSFYVMANAPEGEFADVDEISDLASKEVEFCDSDLFFSSAEGEHKFDKDTALEIGLTRLESKITVESLSADLLGQEEFTGSTVIMEKIFLTGLADRCGWSLRPVLPDGSATVANWKTSKVMNIKLESSTSNVVESLYCFPNPGQSGHCTSVVAQLSIDGIVTYYPIEIPEMKCNTEYVIRNIRIKGWGSDDPSTPVEREVIGYSIALRPWTESSKEVDFN